MALKINIPPPPSVRATTQFVGSKGGNTRGVRFLPIGRRSGTTSVYTDSNNYIEVTARSGTINVNGGLGYITALLRSGNINIPLQTEYVVGSFNVMTRSGIVKVFVS